MRKFRLMQEVGIPKAVLIEFSFRSLLGTDEVTLTISAFFFKL